VSQEHLKVCCLCIRNRGIIVLFSCVVDVNATTASTTGDGSIGTCVISSASVLLYSAIVAYVAAKMTV